MSIDWFNDKFRRNHGDLAWLLGDEVKLSRWSDLANLCTCPYVENAHKKESPSDDTVSRNKRLFDLLISSLKVTSDSDKLNTVHFIYEQFNLLYAAHTSFMRLDIYCCHLDCFVCLAQPIRCFKIAVWCYHAVHICDSCQAVSHRPLQRCLAKAHEVNTWRKSAAFWPTMNVCVCSWQTRFMSARKLRTTVVAYRGLTLIIRLSSLFRHSC